MPETTDNFQNQILKKLGIEKLNTMQAEAIPFLRENIGARLIAPTGSGKTLAYLLALIPKLNQSAKGVQSLIIVPTRELAIQVEGVIRSLSIPFKVNACYGGHSFEVEKRNLSFAPAILVGTPGRLVDHLQRGTLDLSEATSLIIDEFDKCLEMGFEADMGKLLKALGKRQTTWLTSATDQHQFPPFLDKKDFKILKHKDAEGESTQAPLSDRLSFFRVECGSDQTKSLMALLHSLPNEATVVFFNQKDTLNEVAKHLRYSSLFSVKFHGDMDQLQREKALALFRNGSSTILLATDLAARGLDIPEVNHVIHFDMPERQAAFLHRNGRTARVARTGNVYLIDTGFIPQFIDQDLQSFDIDESKERRSPEWATLFISGGRKNKINKFDLVGFFMKACGLNKEELGLIEVKDYMSFVAVKRKKFDQIIAKSKGQKIKKQNVRVEKVRF